MISAFVRPEINAWSTRVFQRPTIRFQARLKRDHLVLYHEGLYRNFANRRDVAAYAGLVPTPWRSGSIDREQGISKAGNPRLRRISRAAR